MSDEREKVANALSAIIEGVQQACGDTNDTNVPGWLLDAVMAITAEFDTVKAERDRLLGEKS